MNDSELLKKVMEVFNLSTQGQVEVMTGISQSTISKHLSGKEISLSKSVRKFLQYLLFHSGYKREFQVTLDADLGALSDELRGIAEQLDYIRENARLWDRARVKYWYTYQAQRVADLQDNFKSIFDSWHVWKFFSEDDPTWQEIKAA